jgi:hypothetical protein
MADRYYFAVIKKSFLLRRNKIAAEREKKYPGDSSHRSVMPETRYSIAQIYKI